MKPTPLLTQYIQSVENAADCFKTLLPIAPIIENGKPKFASGGFAIVFKMQGGDKKNLAVKCFTSEQAERGRRFQKIQQFLKQNPMPFWIDFQYIESELWVNTTPQDGDEYDIVAMPWVEGRTLGEAVREACQRGDKSALRQLLTKFIDMALLLLALPCAHGDLKHDNIMVGNDGKLYLVDYDGFFVPDFKGEKSQERGSDDYQHPSRNTTTFDRHIDDFSIAIIALSLAALCECPDLYAQYNQGQNLIFSRADFAQNTLSQATIWAGLQLPKPITELLKYTEQQNSYKLPMLSGYLLESQEEADEKLPIFNQTNDSLQIWWDNLTDLEREVLTINYKLSKIGWAIPLFYKYNSILKLAYLVRNIADNVDLSELVRLEKLILRGEDFNKLGIINLKFIYIFANLQELYCNYTKITSLSDIKNCMNLQSLNFSDTQIPSLSDIENCVNLQSLNFSNTQIRSLSGIEKYANLQSLDCNHTQIRSLSGIEKCVNLQQLYCYVTEITSLLGIESCINLQKIDCRTTPIKSLSGIENCINLQKIDCANTRITSLSGIENCVNLQILSCHSTNITSLSSIENCVNLQEICLKETQITSLSGLENCVNLQKIDCRYTKIRNLQGLENCINLQTIYCWNTNVTEQEIDRLKKILPYCKIDNSS